MSKLNDICVEALTAWANNPMKTPLSVAYNITYFYSMGRITAEQRDAVALAPHERELRARVDGEADTRHEV